MQHVKHHRIRLLVLALILALVLVPLTRASAQTDVFINEIHYDNDGTDTGEAIEIAGPAGTDLAGWSIVLYNGSGGAVYNTTGLSGTIPDQDNGYGTLIFTYPSNGIQNGSPDGIALVAPGDVVVQFLSYEGTFTAVGGPADGLASVDIGVQEGSSTPAGDSLQLVGTGTTYADFAWSGPATSSYGAVNAGQSFGGGVTPPAVLINEVDSDTSSYDTLEFIELYDGGAGNTSLDGTVVVLYNGNGDAAYDAFDLDGYVTDADGYFVIGTVPEAGLYVDPGSSGWLQNGADAVAGYAGGPAPGQRGRSRGQGSRLQPALPQRRRRRPQHGFVPAVSSHPRRRERMRRRWPCVRKLRRPGHVHPPGPGVRPRQPAERLNRHRRRGRRRRFPGPRHPARGLFRPGGGCRRGCRSTHI